MQIRIFGYHSTGNGLGEMARQLARAISLLGEDVCCVDMQTELPPISFSPDMAHFLNSHQEEREPHISVYCCIPPHYLTLRNHDKNPTARIGFTMIEGKGPVIPLYRDECQKMDLILVPSESSRDSFAAGGVTRPICLVPLGIDTELFSPRPLKVVHDRFKFLSVFEWGARARKGFDVLIRAYFSASKASDAVELVIKTTTPLERTVNTHCPGEVLAKSVHHPETGKLLIPAGKVLDETDFKILASAEIEEVTIRKNELFESLRDARKVMGLDFVPKISLIPGYLSQSELPALYQKVDCAVLPTRAEGWCMPALEAMSCGVPVIITGEGGQLAFCNQKNSLLIRNLGYDDPPEYDRKSIFASIKWAEPDALHLARLMRWAVSHPGELRQIAHRGRQTAAQFTWENSAKQFLKILKEEFNYGSEGSPAENRRGEAYRGDPGGERTEYSACAS